MSEFSKLQPSWLLFVFAKKVLWRHSHVSSLWLVYMYLHVMIAMWFSAEHKLCMCIEVDLNCLSVFAYLVCCGALS